MSDTIRIRVNGREREVRRDVTIRTFLEDLELVPALVVVERNREILSRDRYGETTIGEGDTLELVHFVGGG